MGVGQHSLQQLNTDLMVPTAPVQSHEMQSFEQKNI